MIITEFIEPVSVHRLPVVPVRSSGPRSRGVEFVNDMVERVPDDTNETGSLRRRTKPLLLFFRLLDNSKRVLKDVT